MALVRRLKLTKAMAESVESCGVFCLVIVSPQREVSPSTGETSSTKRVARGYGRLTETAHYELKINFRSFSAFIFLARVVNALVTVFFL